MGKRRFDLSEVRGVLVESVFVADGLGIAVLADIGVEPTARVLAASFPGECETPFAEMLFQDLLIERGEVADAVNAEALQVLLRDLADARHFANLERCEVTGLES